MAGDRIDPWKIEEVWKYLAKQFPGSRLDDYARGATAHLFVVTEGGLDIRKRQRHNLFVTRQFFERFPDPSTLRDALESGDVAKSMSRAGERSIDLY